MIPIPVTFGYVHGGSEIWYNNDNSPVSSFVACPYNKDDKESRSCSHGKINIKVTDHFTYLGKNVSGRCQAVRTIFKDEYLNELISF